MHFSFHDLKNPYEVREDFPRPNWDAAAAWVDTHMADDYLDEAWTAIATAWLDLVRESLPQHYAVVSSENFLMLSGYESRQVKQLLRTCEHCRSRILRLLPGVANESGYGPHVVLSFDEVELYYAYISDFYPEEGHFGESAGMFIDRGYHHIAMNHTYDWYLSRVIAHETCHMLLSHLPLPMWLDEGVTQVIEDQVLEGSGFLMNGEILQKHRAYWNRETIQQFWSGDSFNAADEGQELSYSLAQVIVRNLVSDFPDKLSAIVGNAHYQDAGNAAFESAIEETLGDQVELFLGEGDWQPRGDFMEPVTHPA